MAKAPTEEQQQLRRRARRRLVGAITLVTVVAVVLPWVLEREPPQSDQQIAVQIPSPDASKFEPRVPAAAPASEEKAASSEPAPEPESQPSRSATPEDGLRAEQDKVLAAPSVKVAQPAPGKDKPSVKEKPAPAPEPKKKAVEKPDAAADAKSGTPSRPYVVQVAALADADKAAEIQKALAAKGLKAYTEKIKTAAGEVTRVRVGPFPNRDAAEKERGRMKALGFDGNVAPR